MVGRLLRKRRNLPEEKIIEEYKSGLSCKRLATKYNCAYGTILNILKRHNIERTLAKKKIEHSLDEAGNELKRCTVCHKWKLLAEYCKNKQVSDGLNCYCRICYQIITKRTNEKNKEKRKQKYTENKDEVLEKRRIYVSLNENKIKQWVKNNREYINAYDRERRIKNPSSKIANNLSRRIRTSLKRVDCKKNKRSIELIGCSIEYLKTYLSKRFKNGMNWNNYGQWEIDHIRPCSSFDLTDLEQQKICFHYTNLQPLWKSENRKKGNRFVA